MGAPEGAPGGAFTFLGRAIPAQAGVAGISGEGF